LLSRGHYKLAGVFCLSSWTLSQLRVKLASCDTLVLYVVGDILGLFWENYAAYAFLLYFFFFYSSD
jgi:hypothetical protein